MPGGYPWSVLKIDPTYDVGEIRRAYARRLRSARPDENAAAFQDLVQARDLALKLASQRRSPDNRTEVQAEAKPQLGEAIVTTVTVTFGAEEMEPQPSVSPPPPPASTPARPVPQPLPPPPALVVQRQDGPPPASPQAVIAAARQMFESDALENWRQVFGQLGDLPQRSRVAVEKRLLELTAGYAQKKQSELARKRKTNQPFFEMLAALNAEFGWRERDRVIYNALDVAQADAFVSLLDRASRQPPTGPAAFKSVGLLDQHHDKEGFTPGQRRDSYYYFDHNSDLRGLGLCRKLLADPLFWRNKDASTALFAPMRPRNRRDALGLPGVVFGWTTLLFALTFQWFWVLPIPLIYYVLRDIHLSDPPQSKPWTSIHRALWLIMQAAFAIWIGAAAALAFTGVQDWERWLYAPIAVVFGYCAYAVVRLLVGTSKKQQEEHLAWDRTLLLLFPLVAYNRRYYARAASGFLAWFAVLGHESLASLQFFVGGDAHPGDLVLLAMVLSLHLSAGYNGGRWLVLRFFSTILRADQKGLFKPEQRSAFLLTKGTGKSKSRQPEKNNYSTLWWWFLVAVGVLAHVLKLLGMK